MLRHSILLFLFTHLLRKIWINTFVLHLFFNSFFSIFFKNSTSIFLTFCVTRRVTRCLNNDVRMYASMRSNVTIIYICLFLRLQNLACADFIISSEFKLTERKRERRITWAGESNASENFVVPIYILRFTCTYNCELHRITWQLLLCPILLVIT